MNARVNIACTARKEAGEEQYVVFDPQTESVAIRLCDSCEGTIQLVTDPDVQYKAKTYQGRFVGAIVHGRCRQTGRNYRRPLEQADIIFQGQDIPPASIIP